MALLDGFTADIFSDPFFRQVVPFIHANKSISAAGQPEYDPEPVMLVCIIHPASKDDLAILPEGERYNPAITIYTQGIIYAGDLVTYQGMTWRVTNDANWITHGYFQTVAIRYEGSETENSENFEIPVRPGS